MDIEPTTAQALPSKARRLECLPTFMRALAILAEYPAKRFPPGSGLVIAIPMEDVVSLVHLMIEAVYREFSEEELDAAIATAQKTMDVHMAEWSVKH